MKNPESYIGTFVKIKRMKKTVKARLCEIGEGRFFHGAWEDHTGKPTCGMVPFAEVEKVLGIGKND